MRDTQTDYEKIADLNGRVTSLGATLGTMALLVNQEEKWKDYGFHSQRALSSAESIAVDLRDVVLSQLTTEREPILLGSAESMKISVTFEDGIFRAVLPRQLPRRWRNASFLTHPLMAAMNRLAGEQPLPAFEEAAVCFIHLYDMAVSPRAMRDYDNTESKQILDVLSPFLLVDDAPLYCDVYHSFERGEDRRTEVYVMEKSDFPAWVNARKSPQNGCPK